MNCRRNVNDLTSVAIADLVAEVDARTSGGPDLGLSEHVCPRCSTSASEVFGTWSRREWRFDCSKCGVTIYGDDRYQTELDEYEIRRRRTRRTIRRAKKAFGQLRRAALR